jgi:hypothetical protein
MSSSVRIISVPVEIRTRYLSKVNLVGRAVTAVHSRRGIETGTSRIRDKLFTAEMSWWEWFSCKRANVIKSRFTTAQKHYKKNMLYYTHPWNAAHGLRSIAIYCLSHDPFLLYSFLVTTFPQVFHSFFSSSMYLSFLTDGYHLPSFTWVASLIHVPIILFIHLISVLYFRFLLYFSILFKSPSIFFHRKTGLEYKRER